MNLLFNSDIANLLLKTIRGWGRGRGGGGETKGLTFFLVWSAFIFGGWVVVAWSRKSCLGLTKITSFVFLVLSKDEGCRVSPRFHLFVSDVNPGNKDARWAQNYLMWPKGWKDYP